MHSSTRVAIALCMVFLPAVVIAAGVGGRTAGYLYTLDDNFMINRTLILANGTLGRNTVFIDGSTGGKYFDKHRPLSIR
jgi:hypothetical protein